ncbi:Piso0_001729 [Millerozyma farinosa CBS 7064]|uniref:Peptide:N-glycanase 1 n=1 Tax=Pichia sorbitophila (strain ATCC MYA-4447 / BCRC 22081 / CBS 7064 / NBRC 10061 / NRRL Y-12695) TaxID=559304 RepID=G8YNX9_PICSO|nr:Piso0_001729 [Millerozyma farinosa CBS 7064]
MESIKDKLIIRYAEKVLERARNNPEKVVMNANSIKDKQFLWSIASMLGSIKKYKDPSKTDKALEAIDLGRIYENAEKLEKEAHSKSDGSELAYQDFLVKSLLPYFKNSFFKWVNAPECPQCHHNGDNLIRKGILDPPSPNPHEISSIEDYFCKDCQVRVTFPRYNDCVKLLETRSGRCGEWVNCFLLILCAVLGEETFVRYVWNKEDHVWCEYYSNALKRWVHLDPCEGAFDEPSIYCENWGKKMSWCFGFGETYIFDLSAKYITKPDKQINKKNFVSSLENVNRFVVFLNQKLLLQYFQEKIDCKPISNDKKMQELYYSVILVHNKELKSLRQQPAATSSENVSKGRQSGNSEWVKARGEDGT